MVNVPILSMVDDKLAISQCGQESLSLNTHINTHIELKKLKFHTPDFRGKTKCHKMHVGPPNMCCPNLKVHDTAMESVSEDVYLGDVVRVDGKNSSNIQNRVSKGIGLIAQIMNILETISFGKRFFQISFSLREAIFLNGILTNVEVWYSPKKSVIQELESIDKLLLRRILSAPSSTCCEALFLETGCLDISTIIKGRRFNYLHYLANQEKSSMLYKFFKVQWDFPAKGDWTLDAKLDLLDFDIPDHLGFLQGKSKKSSDDVETKDGQFWSKLWEKGGSVPIVFNTHRQPRKLFHAMQCSKKKYLYLL